MVLRGWGAEERVEQCLYYVFEISSQREEEGFSLTVRLPQLRVEHIYKSLLCNISPLKYGQLFISKPLLTIQR